LPDKIYIQMARDLDRQRRREEITDRVGNGLDPPRRGVAAR